MRGVRRGLSLTAAMLFFAGAAPLAGANPGVVATPRTPGGRLAEHPPIADEVPLVRSGQLRVAWIDLVRIPPVLFETLTAEATSLLAPAGLSVSWEPAPPSDSAHHEKLRVVLMASSAVADSGNRPMLGSAHPTGRSPTVRIYHPTVLRVLGLPGSATPTLRPRHLRRLGVALGRVVAHEIVHALRPDLPHTRHGLMARELSLDCLVRGHVRMSDQAVAALRASAPR